MFKKILIGALAVAIAGGIAASGYQFGKYLAGRDAKADAGAPAPRDA